MRIDIDADSDKAVAVLGLGRGHGLPGFLPMAPTFVATANCSSLPAVKIDNDEQPTATNYAEICTVT